MSKQEILNGFSNPMLYSLLWISMFIVEFIEYFIYILLKE